MLYSSLIVAVSALAGFAAAQNNTVIPCCTVSVSSVPESDRQDWCNAQENTCVDLCGGQGDIASNGNTCDATTLDYTCKCSNGTDISSSMSTYQQTVPAQMCYYWFNTCINATIGANGEGNAAEQYNCEQARDSKCGNTTIDDSSSGSSSSAASSATPSSSGGASAASSSPTGSGSAAASSGAAVANFAFGTPALAGGLLAIFGLAL
ncbi:hypothetical protein EJ07DRAFT_117042 [Lizonia empirigonia]|nr:hypothetical protein EJ07DRAFT_117042 [Lizonia empirigonia]